MSDDGSEQAMQEEVTEETQQQQQDDEESMATYVLSVGPTATLSMMYASRDTVTAKEDWLNQDEMIKREKALLADTEHMRAYLRESGVNMGTDNKLVAVPSVANRFMSFESAGECAVERSDFMMQGPAPSGVPYTPGVRHNKMSLPRFPRSAGVLLSNESALRALDNDGKALWSDEQERQVRGGLVRIGAPIMLASKALLGAKAFVAFPGTCANELEPVGINELDLTPAPFTSISTARCAAVIYTRPQPGDFIDADAQRGKIDQYALDVVDNGKLIKTKVTGDIAMIPRFALVHCVQCTLPELIERLRAEASTDIGDGFEDELETATRHIAGLNARYPEGDVGLITFYAYQLLDEKEALSAGLYETALRQTDKKSEPSDETLQHNIKQLVAKNNKLICYVDWQYTINCIGLKMHAYAEIAVPMVPHAVYAYFHQQYHAANGTARTQQPRARTAAAAIAPIGAEHTEEAVIKKRRVEFKLTPGQPAVVTGIEATKIISSVPPPTEAAPTTNAPTAAQSKFRQLTNSKAPITGGGVAATAVAATPAAKAAASPAKKKQQPETAAVESSTGEPVAKKPAAKKKKATAAAAAAASEDDGTASAVGSIAEDVLASGSAWSAGPTETADAWPVPREDTEGVDAAAETAVENAAVARKTPVAAKSPAQTSNKKVKLAATDTNGHTEAPVAAAAGAVKFSAEELDALQFACEISRKLQASGEPHGIFASVAGVPAREYATYPVEPSTNYQAAMVDGVSFVNKMGLGDVFANALAAHQRATAAAATAPRAPTKRPVMQL